MTAYCMKGGTSLDGVHAAPTETLHWCMNKNTHKVRLWRLEETYRSPLGPWALSALPLGPLCVIQCKSFGQGPSYASRAAAL